MAHPQGYLRWASLQAVERSPERWADEFLLGNPFRGNAAIAYGAKLADALRDGTETGDIVLDTMISRIPKLELMDEGAEAILEVGGRRIPVYSHPDSRSRDWSAIYEYKTGRVPWTQAKVDAFDQITFYAMLGYLCSGKIAETLELIWIPTRVLEDGRIQATGDIHRFPTRRTMTDVARMMARTAAAWEKQCQLTEQHMGL